MSIIDLLRQDLIWRGQDGRVYVVDDMDHDYHVNLLNYLRRNAARLHDHAIWYDAYNGVDEDNASIGMLESQSLSRALESRSRSSLDWLNDQPLTRRLIQLINRHNSIEPDILALGEQTGTVTDTRVTDGDSHGLIGRTPRDAR